MRTDDIHTLARDLGLLLKKTGLTFCAAESCTGGMLLSALTDIPGSSGYVLGGLVTYSNAAKIQLAQVAAATIEAHGAVSPQTAREMALGVRGVFDADIAISITGIAGPGGGTPEKPVGLTYIGMVTSRTTQVQQQLWRGDRVANKAQSVGFALHWVAETVKRS
jgi:PncC family amidohydrolase